MRYIRKSVKTLIAVFSLLMSNDLAAQPFKVGEKLTFEIQKLKVPAGKATLEFKGLVKLKDEDVVLIIFTATGPKFFDEDKIYVDPKEFKPIRVERNLNIFGSKEEIVEEYERARGLVTITKQAGGKTTTQTLEKEARMDNIYGFIYRYRQSGNFEIGNTVKLNLPTKDIAMKVVKQYKIGVNGKTYDSFLLQSDPKRYNVWFDTSSSKLPLRIDGALGMGKTSMMLEKVE